MSQFGIDITFQFDPDASTIAAWRPPPSLVSLVFFFFSRQPFVILSSSFATPINGQGWTPMISRLSRRDADIEIARWR